MEIPIIYQDNDIIVINKPAGLLVHPSETSGSQKTLLDYFPKAILVHRLDQDTSGLMILAKNDRIAEYLKEQFKQRNIKKTYLALVHGNFKDETGIITKTISKTRKRGGSQTTVPMGTRREAITRYKVLKQFSGFSLLEAHPETGRTHQIRVHMASIGHPLAGDEKYKFKRQKTIKGLNRQFLHAKRIKFPMPDNSIKEFETDLPEDLKKIINLLNNEQYK